MPPAQATTIAGINIGSVTRRNTLGGAPEVSRRLFEVTRNVATRACRMTVA